MKNKNLPNRLTNLRLIISFIIIIMLLFPFSMVDVSFPKLLINNTILLDSKMILVGILFILALITDFLDGFIARKKDSVSDYGKLMDPIADRILINSTLIILSSNGYIPAVVPVICIIIDIIIDTFRVNNAEVFSTANSGKFKTIFLMIGITLKLFGNLPFGLINISMDDFFIIAGTLLSLMYGIEYYISYKKYLTKK